MTASTTLQPLAFAKMHGLGNDFVVIDLRDGSARPSDALIRALADRHRGVGYDQLALIESDPEADLALTFYNSDGSQSAACGNATRCIAAREIAETAKSELTIRTARGLLSAADAGGGLTRVNMGAPALDWKAIPLAEEMDTLELPIEGSPVGTGMGNPHCTFFVEDAEAVALEPFGARYERHPLFPERTNVEVVQILSPDAIRVRVWERGTGVTLASGSCACAAVVAAARRGLTGERVKVHLDGGMLAIDWRSDGVWMAGPSETVFEGHLAPDFMAAHS